MITTEDRARAAMQAIGDTVRDAPPLELAPAARCSRRSRTTLPLGEHSARRRAQPAPPGGWLVPAVPLVPAAAAGIAGGGQGWPRSPPRSQSRPSPSRW